MSALVAYTLTLNGSIQNLATALAAVLPAGNNFVKSVSLQAGSANGGTTYVGDAAVAATDAGSFLAASAAIAFNGGDSGAVDLSSLNVLGTNNDKLFISVLP